MTSPAPVTPILYSVRIEYGLFHNTYPKARIATALVAYRGDKAEAKLSFNREVAKEVLPGHEATLREWAVKAALEAVESYRRDSRYPIIWDENTCLECTVVQ